MDKDAILQHIEAWMRSGRATLFGRAFDVSKDPSTAARWFEQQMSEFLDYVEAQTDTTVR